MTDDLDAKTEEEISEIFAVEVAGYWKSPSGFYHLGNCVCCSLSFSFATSFDAVQPWMEKYDMVDIFYSNEYKIWHAKVWNNGATHNSVCAKTLPRAACIALIRAKRREKEGVE